MPAEQRLSGSEVRRRVPKNSVWDSANYPLALVGLVSRETGRVRDLKQLASGDGGSSEGPGAKYFMPLPCLPCPRRALRISPGPSQVVVRREPSRVGLISVVGRSTFRAELRTFNPKKGVDMRAHRIFLSFAITMGCSITLQSTAFSQEHRGTQRSVPRGF